jgi:hypothetical protein
MFAPYLIAALLSAAPRQAAPQEVPVLKANLGGDCSADFVVSQDGQPVYNATIHVRVRYGALSLKRSDLEIGTNSEGKARIEGLPAKAKPLAYEVHKDAKKQDVATMCHAMFDVTLK